MSQFTFNLQVTKEDLTDLYKDQTTFRLFSKEYAGRLFFIAVAFILFLITFIATLYTSDYAFYMFLFLAGMSYCSYDIYKSYLTKTKKKKSVEAWADDVIKFKEHQINVSDKEITYKRDAEIFSYPFQSIHTYNAHTYFQVLVNDGSELLIPKNAFTNNDYDKFVLATESKKRAVTTPAL